MCNIRQNELELIYNVTRETGDMVAMDAKNAMTANGRSNGDVVRARTYRIVEWPK